MGICVLLKFPEAAVTAQTTIVFHFGYPFHSARLVQMMVVGAMELGTGAIRVTKNPTICSGMLSPERFHSFYMLVSRIN